MSARLTNKSKAQCVECHTYSQPHAIVSAERLLRSIRMSTDSINIKDLPPWYLQHSLKSSNSDQMRYAECLTFLDVGSFFLEWNKRHCPELVMICGSEGLGVGWFWPKYTVIIARPHIHCLYHHHIDNTLEALPSHHVIISPHVDLILHAYLQYQRYLSSW